MPVLQWDSQKISEKPGPITMNIQKFFNEVDCKMKEETAAKSFMVIDKTKFEFKEEDSATGSASKTK